MANTTLVASRSSVQFATIAVSLVFLLVGVLGFVPGATTNYDQLTFAGPMSGAALLGMTSLGLVDSLDRAADLVEVAAVERPEPGEAEAYARLRPVFEQAYAALAPVFSALR